VNNLTEQDKLTNEGMDIVVRVCNFWVNRYQLNNYLSKEDIEDLKQECSLSVLKVIKNFDSTKGVKLASYLRPRIDGTIKDCLAAMNLDNRIVTELTLIEINSHLDCFRGMTNEQVTIKLDSLNTSRIKEIVVELGNQDFAREIFDAMLLLGESKKEVIVGYYLLDETIKDMSERHGFSPDSGWMYRLKREGIIRLREILKERGVL
jgi:RNA polymerase sigma factor (sigma-70 family)